MGLNITAYGRLVKIEDEEIEFGDYGLTINERINICKGEKYSFRVGNYAGFKAWKDQLAQLAGYKDSLEVWNTKQAGPFVELINFSDCEGTIGYIIASKLAKDFKEYNKMAKNSLTPFFYDIYQSWQKCFEIATKDGAIQFH
jgi:hypothetical protein